MWIRGTSMMLTGDDVPFTYIWFTRWTCFPLWYIDPFPGDEAFLDGNDFFVLSGGLTYLYESQSLFYLCCFRFVLYIVPASWPCYRQGRYADSGRASLSPSKTCQR